MGALFKLNSNHTNTSVIKSNYHKNTLIPGTIVRSRMCPFKKRRETGVSNHKRTETWSEETLSLIYVLRCCTPLLGFLFLFIARNLSLLWLLCKLRRKWCETNKRSKRSSIARFECFASIFKSRNFRFYLKYNSSFFVQKVWLFLILGRGSAFYCINRLYISIHVEYLV